MKINNIEQITYFTIESDLREILAVSDIPVCEGQSYTIINNMSGEFISYIDTPTTKVLCEYFNSYDINRIPFDEYEIFISINSEETIVEITS